MTVGEMRVDNYMVHVLARREDTASPPYSRRLILESIDPNSGSYKYVFIYFFQEPAPSDFGGRTSDGGVIVNLPLRDFDHMYHLLQTEKPVFAAWGVDSDGIKLNTFKLRTNRKEPLGEGLQDTIA